MKRFFSYLLLAAFLVSALAGCSSGKGKIIPKDKMAQIYAEMFMTDQWFNTYYNQNAVADTSRVYEPIFNKYGYTTIDYLASVEYYMVDPDRYARIIRKTVSMLETDQEKIKEAVKVFNARKLKAEAIRKYRPRRFYYLTSTDCPTTFKGACVDSLGGKWNFTPRYVPKRLVMTPDDSR